MAAHASNEPARIHHDLGDNAIAAVQYEQLLKQIVARLGSDHPHAASVQASLGLCYSDLGRYSDAIGFLEQSLQRQRSNLGDDHPDAVWTLDALARAYKKAKRHREAITHFERLRQIRTANLGASHHDTLSTTMALADANHAAGDPAKAVVVYEQIRDVQRKTLPADDPKLLLTLHQLANALMSAKRPADAATIGESLVRDRTKLLGPDHEDTTTSVYNLAFAYQEMDDLSRAIPLFERAASSIEKGGFKHPLATRILPTMVGAFEKAGKLGEADGLRRNWLAAMKRRGDGESQLYVWQLESLAESLLQKEKWAEAEASLRESSAIREKTHPNSPLRSRTQVLLGSALTGRKKFSDAESALLQGYEGLSRAIEKESRPPQRTTLEAFASEALDRLIELYSGTNKPDEVKKWQSERAKYRLKTPNIQRPGKPATSK